MSPDVNLDLGLDLESRAAAAWMLGSFIVVFLGTRLIVRLIRAGKGPFRNQAIGGVHLHHLVWGIFLMLIAGVGEFTYQPEGPWLYVLAAAFGAGAALTLDEFALWLHLSDVYWEREGRVSVDAVLVVGALMALLVVGANPFDSETGDGVVAVVSTIVVGGLLAIVALFKGRPLLGLLGLLVPVLALFAAVRLARPTSPWARWRYPEGSSKALRSRRRFPERDSRRWDAVVEAIAGRPNEPQDDRTERPTERPTCRAGGRDRDTTGAGGSALTWTPTRTPTTRPPPTRRTPRPAPTPTATTRTSASRTSARRSSPPAARRGRPSPTAGRSTTRWPTSAPPTATSPPTRSPARRSTSPAGSRACAARAG